MLTKLQASYLRGLICNCRQTKEIKEIREKLNAFVNKDLCYFPDSAELEFFNSLILERMQYYSSRDSKWFSFCMKLHENIANTLYRLNQCKSVN